MGGAFCKLGNEEEAGEEGNGAYCSAIFVCFNYDIPYCHTHTPPTEEEAVTFNSDLCNSILNGLLFMQDPIDKVIMGGVVLSSIFSCTSSSPDLG